MIKTTLSKSLAIINLGIIFILFLSKPSRANNYTINIGSSLNKSDISENCKQVFFYVINEIDSKEPQSISGYLDGNKQNLDLLIILTKNNVMTSPKLQIYWSNLIYEYCPAINQVKFGKDRTDWILKYILKNGNMISAFKEEPDIMGLDYSEARKIILDEGWKPVSARAIENYKYVDFLSSKYPEVYDCAGTGLAPCIFFFDNPDDNYYLKVVTAGQFDDNHRGGKITFVEVRSSMGGAEYKNHFLYQ